MSQSRVAPNPILSPAADAGEPERPPHAPVPTGRAQRLWSAGATQARIATLYGGGWLRNRFANSERRTLEFERIHAQGASRLAASLAELRGAALKVGRVVAWQPGALPEAYSRALGELDRAPAPLDADAACARVEAELGGPLERRFEAFSSVPLAAGSIGQVHAARLTGGERVAVKIQYPGIEDALAADVANVMTLLLPLRLQGAWEEIRATVEEVRATLDRETDYLLEIESLEAARSCLTGMSGVLVPRAFPEHSTRRVLTMERFEGEPLRARLTRELAPDERDALGERLLQVALRLQFSGGLVHGDQDPSNFLCRPDGTLELVDFGGLVHLDEEGQRLLDVELAAFKGDEGQFRVLLRSALGLRPDDRPGPRQWKLCAELFEWLWRPYRAAFHDFSDPQQLRDGRELLRRLRASRAYLRPAFHWQLRMQFGLRATLQRLGSVVSGRDVFAEERARRPSA